MLRQGRIAVSLSTALLAALVCSTPVAVANQSEAKSPVVSVLLRVKQKMVKASDPVVVERTLTNRSDHEVTFVREVNHPGCPVDVLDASGNFAGDTKLGYRHGRLDLEQLAPMNPEQVAKSGLLSGKLAWIKLKPSEAFVEMCDASSFYNLTRPGQYFITSHFRDPESAVLIRSNTVEVTVAK